MKNKIEDIKVVLQAQHPGKWGPWYHESIYRLTPRGTWRFCSEAGRLGHGSLAHLTPSEWRERCRGKSLNEIKRLISRYNNRKEK